MTFKALRSIQVVEEGSMGEGGGRGAGGVGLREIVEKSGIVAHICNPSTQENEAGLPEVYSMFQASLDYRVNYVSKKEKKKKILDLSLRYSSRLFYSSVVKIPCPQ